MEKGGESDFNVDDFMPKEDTFTRLASEPQVLRGLDEVKEQLARRLGIAFVGTTNAGKTSGIKSLFDVNLGSIHPIPGYTKEVKVFQFDESVSIVDTPGFGDVKKEVSQKARDACELADIFIYVLNAQGGFRRPQKEDYQSLLTFGRDVLVVLNKIDTIRERLPGEKQQFIEHSRNEMGVSSDNFIDVAFDPIPEKSPVPINVDRVSAWIQKKLEGKGKDLLFAKVLRCKDKSCDQWILAACGTAATIGALPIPGSDIVGITALQVGLVTKIAKVYGFSINKKDALQFITATLTGQAGRQVYRWFLSALKSAGWIPFNQASLIVVGALAASIAASMTFGLGRTAKAYYKNGKTISLGALGDIFQSAYDSYYASKAKKE